MGKISNWVWVTLLAACATWPMLILLPDGQGQSEPRVLDMVLVDEVQCDRFRATVPHAVRGDAANCRVTLGRFNLTNTRLTIRPSNWVDAAEMFEVAVPPEPTAMPSPVPSRSPAPTSSPTPGCSGGRFVLLWKTGTHGEMLREFTFAPGVTYRQCATLPAVSATFLSLSAVNRSNSSCNVYGGRMVSPSGVLYALKPGVQPGALVPYEAGTWRIDLTLDNSETLCATPAALKQTLTW